jgi:hypothetical protein
MVTRRTLLQAAVLAPVAALPSERRVFMSPALGAPYAGEVIHLPTDYAWDVQNTKWKEWAYGHFLEVQ